MPVYVECTAPYGTLDAVHLHATKDLDGFTALLRLSLTDKTARPSLTAPFHTEDPDLWQSQGVVGPTCLDGDEPPVSTVTSGVPVEERPVPIP